MKIKEGEAKVGEIEKFRIINSHEISHLQGTKTVKGK